MNIRRFFAVLAARNREFLRDRTALAWNILFPVMIVGGFAFAFSGGPVDLYKVGVLGGAAPEDGFFATAHVDFIPVTDLERGVAKVTRHQLDLLVDPVAGRYWINDTSPKGYMLERVLWGTAEVRPEKQAVSGRPIRYVDWLLPGILAMNMMFSALFGVGYTIVRYRKNGVLKRLQATPLSAFEFLSAQVVSRLWLILLLSAAIFVGTDLFIDYPMFGSYLNLLLVFTLGAMSVISLGLVIAARVRSEEFAGGLLNMISWPMMFLSGVWFSLEGVHPLLQKLALIFPLTHVTEAARAIMFDGASLADISGALTTLAGMTVLFLAAGAASFRWE